MPNIVEVKYAQTGESTATNSMGMREMQSKAYEARDSQYLLIKAPPASGKSRALMFLALDKLSNQGVRKVIVAVPEKSIGSSFSSVSLTENGFFADWSVAPNNNLCTPGGDKNKVAAFERFLNGDDRVLVCTHATLRFAFDAVNEKLFDDTLLAVDEFHHVSADVDTSKLGQIIKSLMRNTSASIIAMTGSYFRGDTVAVLSPEDEAKFTKVTYNYYQQLNGYTYLKSLGIGYHFYQGSYATAIGQVLDTDKKTILHIPSVQSGESTKNKINEVDTILDNIGELIDQDPDTGIMSIRRADGKIIRVADLVLDTPRERDKVVNYLRTIKSSDDVDLIIALGMAKEGFDWPYCEHALTIGYRGSLTEIIQIIGRCTRDSENKIHAQFTNLIAQPDATDGQVKVSVNNMLKAITASLLMEQVLAPNFKFRTKLDNEDSAAPGEILIKGFKQPRTQRVKDIVESDLNDLKAVILQDDNLVRALPGTSGIDPEVINKVLIPKIIREKYPDLDEEEVEELRQHVVVDSVIKNGEIKESGGKQFVRMADKFINIDELNIDLIDKVNPFQKAFEILSKSVTPQVLKTIIETIESTRLQITEKEAIILYPKIKDFVLRNDSKKPDITSHDPVERRLAEALLYLQRKKRETAR